jgi:GGDEF domain-containing protein
MMDNNFPLNPVFENYPSSFFLVKPIIKGDSCDDFTYIYVNPAFCRFIGKDVDELIGRTFRQAFGKDGELFWLNLFYETASKKIVRYAENTTTVLRRRLSVESFHVEPDMCGCIIRDYDLAIDGVELRYSDSLQNKAYSDALTGAYNQFHLQANEDLFSKTDQIGVAYFDINSLQSVNDIMGHGAGDKVLCDFVRVLTTYYNKSLVYRIGGDEFLVITSKMPEQIFTESCHSFKRTLDASGNAAIGYKFYSKAPDIWEAVDECCILMQEHKAAMKKSH